MADYYSLSLPLLALPEDEPSPLLVTPESSMRLRKHVERFALHFKRELHYSFPQFDASETKDKRGFIPWEAYLFHAAADDSWNGESPLKRRFFGACCFRWREQTTTPHRQWWLDWIWLHPYFRAHGHLKRAWPIFQRRYEPIGIEEPVSCGMAEFLKKVG